MVTRKKKLRRGWTVQNILPPKKTVPVYVCGRNNDDTNNTPIWFLDSVVRVVGLQQQPPPPALLKHQPNEPTACWIADELHVVQCAPNPDAVAAGIAAIRRCEAPVSILLPYQHKNETQQPPNREDDDRDQQQLQELVCSSNNNDMTKRQISRLIRGLLGRGAEWRGWHRLPHTKRAAVAVLQHFEARHNVVVNNRENGITRVSGGQQQQQQQNTRNHTAEHNQPPLNLPPTTSAAAQDDDDPNNIMMSSRGPLSRAD